MGLVTDLAERHGPLTWVGLACIGFAVVSVLLSLVDSRMVTGLNVWFKPAKFAASIGIYLLTLAWLIKHVAAVAPIARLLGSDIAVLLALEYALIFVQAARGVTSHFNVATSADAAIFGAMGVLIGLNTILLAIVTVLYFQPVPDLAPAYLWGIRLGLVLFIIFSVEGVLMVQNMGHAIGAPEDGPGLPFLGWVPLEVTSGTRISSACTHSRCFRLSGGAPRRGLTSCRFDRWSQCSLWEHFIWLWPATRSS